MIDAYENLFKQNPKEYSRPHKKNEHPESDDSELLDVDGVNEYQHMIDGC